MLGNNSGSALGRILGQSAAAVSTTGDTTEHTLATITIPAGAMGANGRVEVRLDYSWPNSANSKTVKVKLGGTILYSASGTTTTGDRGEIAISNRNSASSQRAIGFKATQLNAIGYQSGTSAIDTTASTDITITAQNGLGTETITLESYQVILYAKA